MSKSTKLATQASNTVCFEYNEDGLRVRKIATSTGTTNYIYHGNKLVHLTNGGDCMHFFYDTQGRAVVVDFNGTSYIYLHNLQGDVTGLLGQGSTLVVNYWYDAWGMLVRREGSLASTLGTLQPFRYRGYVYDEETGLYYLQSRYYNPRWGRFISGDELIGGNAYSYGNNQPIRTTDSNGHKAQIVIPMGPEYIDNSYFCDHVKPRILSLIQSADDYSYESNGYTKPNKKKGMPGSIACGHAMYETTGVKRYTMPYRYTEFKGPKGKLQYREGEFNISLMEGMEVYLDDKSHVGILIRYDLGKGEEWCVFQSASEPYTLGRCLFQNDTGPNITALIDYDNTCHWAWFTYPQYINYMTYDYNKYIGRD